MQGYKIVEAGNAIAEVKAAIINNLVPFSTNLANKVSQLHAKNINTIITSQLQKKIFDAIQNFFCSESEWNKPLIMFVSGCEGTGKSFLIHVIESMVSNHFNNSFTNAAAAPTGLAALNFDGISLYRLWMLPVEHGKTAQNHELVVDSLATMQETLTNLRLLIVDEISMISSLLLAYIRLRLAETAGKNEFFGGICFIFWRSSTLTSEMSSILNWLSSQLIGSVGVINIWKDYFIYDDFILHENDLIYAELLNLCIIFFSIKLFGNFKYDLISSIYCF